MDQANRDLLLNPVGPEIIEINLDHISQEIVKLTSDPGNLTVPGRPGAPEGPGQPYRYIFFYRNKIFFL